MPDPYQNPTYNPPSAPYTWVPPGPPSGGPVPGPAYFSLTLERGTFRNDLPNINAIHGSVNTSFTGTLLSDTGSSDWPILNAFRALSVPDAPVGAAPGLPFITKGQQCSWAVTIISPSNPISSITIEYSVAVNVTDPNIQYILSPVDYAALQAYLTSSGNTSLNIDWSKYILANVLTTDSSNVITEYPLVVNGVHLELQTTDFYPSASVAYQVREVTIPFGTGDTSNSYHDIKTISIQNVYPQNAPEITISINKVMIFNAERTNIDHAQLPCGLLQYAYPVSFNFDPSLGTLTYPDNLYTPNFHVKFIHPDDPSNQFGFAHSISLRFLIFALPIFGVGAEGTEQAYMAVFVGPMDAVLNNTYGILTTPLQSASGYVVRLNDIVLPDQTVSLDLQKAISNNGSSIPGADANWTTIATYNISSPPSINAVTGPWIAPYLYLDIGAKKDDWYRIIDHVSVGGDITGIPMNNQLYIEHTVEPMVSSISGATNQSVQRITRTITLDTAVDPLQSLPLAIFESNDPSPFVGNITIQRGAWNFNIEAAGIDPNGLANMHLYLRFWFRPTQKPVDVNNPHQYRDTTEFYFDSSATETTFVRGTPTSLSQLMVTPPLPGVMTNLELVRYMDKLSTSDGKNFTIPFGSSVQTSLVVGLYATAYPTDAGAAQNLNTAGLNPPYVQFTLDPQNTYVGTSIVQILTGPMKPEKAYVFSGTGYTTPVQPLVVTRFTVGGGIFPGDVAAFVPYNQMFQALSGTNTATSALAGLLSFGSGSAVAGKFCLVYEQISLKQDKSAVYMADFATDVKSYTSGRVLNGNWNILLTLDRAADTTVIGTDYVLEALMVSQNGLVVERVFTTKLVPGLLKTGSGNTVTFTQTIKYPFLITGVSTQLVFRLIAYPYSRDGSVIDLKALTATIGKPVGTRVTEFKVVTHTAETVYINQTDSMSGSPAFYENLPLFPVNALDSQDFWYVADPSNEVTAIVFASTGWPISGTMYSPTWFCTLPKNMEVRLRAASLNTSTENTLWLRTVVVNSISSATEDRVSAVEGHISNTTHVAFNNKVTVSSSGATSPTMTHMTLNNPFQKPLTVASIAGQKSGVTSTMSGINPALLLQNTNNSSKKPSTIGVITELDEPNLSSFISALNMNSGLENRWIGPNRDLGDTDFGTTPRRLMRAASKHSAVASPVDNNIFVVSWVDPGAVVFKRVNPMDAGRNGATAPGPIYVVDANSDIQSTLNGDPNATYIYPPNLNGDVVNTFPGIMIDKSGVITVAYISTGNTNQILARTMNSGGAGFGAAYPIVDLRVLGSIGSNNVSIFAPTLTYHTPTRTSYVAFWVSGKVFVARFDVQSDNGGGVILGPIQLVAGNNDFTTHSNPANPMFMAMQLAGNLINKQSGTPEADVPQQSTGFYVSDNAPFKGDLFVVYKNTQSQVCARHVLVGGGVDAPIILYD